MQLRLQVDGMLSGQTRVAAPSFPLHPMAAATGGNTARVVAVAVQALRRPPVLLRERRRPAHAHRLRVEIARDRIDVRVAQQFRRGLHGPGTPPGAKIVQLLDKIIEGLTGEARKSLHARIAVQFMTVAAALVRRLARGTDRTRRGTSRADQQQHAGDAGHDPDGGRVRHAIMCSTPVLARSRVRGKS